MEWGERRFVIVNASRHNRQVVFSRLYVKMLSQNVARKDTGSWKKTGAGYCSGKCSKRFLYGVYKTRTEPSAPSLVHDSYNEDIRDYMISPTIVPVSARSAPQCDLPV